MLKQRRALCAQRPLCYAMLLASMLLVLAPFSASQAKAQGTTSSPDAQTSTQPAVIYGPGKLNVAPSAAWLQAKNEHRIVKRGRVVTTLTATPLISYPGSWLLDEGVSGSVYEPPPTSTDALGHSYDDGYYGNFCSAGASTVALSYWFNVNVAGWPAGYFTEPASATRRTTTYWNDTDDRAYLMYMAEQVLVPGWTYGGVVTFQTYPNAYAATGDITNALNWEASGHSSNWKGYYYGTYGIGSLSQAQLNSDIMSDIYGDGQGDGTPVVVVTNTGYNGTYLPSWGVGGIIHAISIIGYDNNSQTYTYVETCGGPRSQGGTCGSKGNGIYTISQSAMYYLMQHAVVNGSTVGALIW